MPETCLLQYDFNISHFNTRPTAYLRVKFQFNLNFCSTKCQIKKKWLDLQPQDNKPHFNGCRSHALPIFVPKWCNGYSIELTLFQLIWYFLVSTHLGFYDGSGKNLISQEFFTMEKMDLPCIFEDERKLKLWIIVAFCTYCI